MYEGEYLFRAFPRPWKGPVQA